MCMPTPLTSPYEPGSRRRTCRALVTWSMTAATRNAYECETRSTQAEIHVDVCSACHPFYTGKQKLMDSGGRVERFQRRLERAQAAKPS